MGIAGGSRAKALFGTEKLEAGVPTKSYRAALKRRYRERPADPRSSLAAREEGINGLEPAMDLRGSAENAPGCPPANLGTSENTNYAPVRASGKGPSL